MQIKGLRVEISTLKKDRSDRDETITAQNRELKATHESLKTMKKEYERLKELEDLYTRAAYLVHSTPERILAAKCDSPVQTDTKSDKPSSKGLSLKSEDLMAKFDSDMKSEGKRKR
jgi:hypothetical protein